MTAIGLSIRPGAPRGAPAVAVPTLDLNLLTGTLSPLITPTLRAGSGTAAAGWQFDSTGALVLGTHNLALQSQTFDNASWTKTGTAVTADAVAAPDGTTTADAVMETAVTSAHEVVQTVSFASGVPYTVSVYYRITGTRWLCLLFNNAAGFAHFGSTGTIGTSGGSLSPTSVACTSVGGGWYRASFTVLNPGATLTSVACRLKKTSGGITSYLGETAEGIYLWGLQVDQCRDLRPYVPSTTAAVYGGARIDYDPVTLAVSGLLIEPAATNLFLNSAVGATQDVTVTAAAHTLSFYGTGTVTLTGASTAGPLVGTGASARVTLTFTPTAGALTCTVSGTVSNAQLELGSAATSPIVTVGTAVTRPAETPTVTVVNLAAGALAVEAIFTNTATQAIAVQIDGNAGSNTTRIGVGNNGSGQFRAYFVGGSGSALTAITGGAVAKMAVGWSGVEARGAIGGTLGAAGVMTGALTGATTLRLGRTATASAPFIGHLRRVRLYSARPTDAELQAFTT